jgi:hypothetical protein
MNDYRIFVGAFPEGDLADRIQAVRLKHDAKTARITSPHALPKGPQRGGGGGVRRPWATANSLASLGALRGVAPYHSLVKSRRRGEIIRLRASVVLFHKMVVKSRQPCDLSRIPHE